MLGFLNLDITTKVIKLHFVLGKKIVRCYTEQEYEVEKESIPMSIHYDQQVPLVCQKGSCEYKIERGN